MRAPIVKRFIVTSMIILGVAAGVSSAEEAKSTEQIKWQTDIYAAHDVSVQTGKPMLILVTSESCPPCNKLKSTTLVDPRMVKYINAQFVPVQLHYEKETKVVEILEVQQFPSTVVLSPDADLLGRLVGFASAEEYHKALEKTRRVHKKIESLRQASADKEQK
jgi:protein disulfide-isomerase